MQSVWRWLFAGEGDGRKTFLRAAETQVQKGRKEGRKNDPPS